MKSDRYEIESIAGEGGMGVVYRAIDLSNGQRVAIKMLHKRGERERDLMQREAQIIASIAHPGVVRYIEQGESKDGTLFVVLEWLEGEDLESLLGRQERLSIDETLYLAEQLAETLAAVHLRGIIHRDIKPSNIFLVGASHPDGSTESSSLNKKTKLIDFGIAHQKSLQTVLPNIPKGKAAIVGTLGYMAPEQARGEQKLSASADVFSLGCVLFRCLTGEGPFDGAHEIAILAKILLDETPKLRSLRPDAPSEVEALLTQMLHKTPGARPASGEQLLQLLKETRAAISDPFREHTIVEAREPLRQALTEREQQLFCVLLLQRQERKNNESSAAPRTVAMAAHTMAEVSLLQKTRAEAPETIILQDDSSYSNNTYPRALRALQADVKQEAERFGGRTEALADGSALVFFTGEVATDMAQRAARCAKALQKKFPGRQIALSTGRAEVTARWPVGEVIERAVSLLSLREGDILIDEATAGLISSRFSLQTTENAIALDEEQDAIFSSRTLLGKKTPCVGRESELSLLVNQYEACLLQSYPKSLLLTAEAGTGKSRLREELLLRLSQHETRPKVLVGFGEESHQEEAYGVLLPLLRRTCGVIDNAHESENERRFLARIRRYVPAQRIAHTSAFLGFFLGLEIKNSCAPLLEAARREPLLLGDHLRRAFESWLSAECSASPTLLLIEDWHWCDTATSQLLESLRAPKLLLLLFARPEAISKRWKDSQHLELSPLNKESGVALISYMLGESYAHTNKLWERSGGNAFYLEELIRAASNRSEDEFPETMLAMIQARLSAMGEEERRALRAASIFGMHFWVSAAEELLGAPSLAWGALESSELIEEVQSKFHGEREYRFHHALLREGAYELLTEEDKTLGHRLAGDWLLRMKETDAAMLAEHFTKGDRPQKAIDHYITAASNAISGNDLAGAISLVQRGVALGAKGERLGALLSHEALARNWRAEFALAKDCVEQALRLLPKGEELWCVAAAEAVVAYGRSGAVPLLVELGEELIRLGQSQQSERLLTASTRAVSRLILSGKADVANRLLAMVESLEREVTSASARAWLFVARASNAILRGDLARYSSCMRSSVELFESIGDERNACMQNVDVSFAQIMLGDYQGAYDTCSGVAYLSEKMGLRRVEALNYLYMAQALYGLQLTRQGVQTARLAVEALKEQRDVQTQGAAYTELARLLMLSNAPEDEIEEALQQALALMAPLYPFRPKALAVLSTLRRMQGRVEEAIQIATEAVALIHHGRDFVETLVHYAYVEALDEAGRRAEAREALSLAKEKLMRRANQIADATQREQMLTNVPENQKTLALAISWGIMD
jgi:serine/threonine protein kinase/predicted ATPase